MIDDDVEKSVIVSAELSFVLYVSWSIGTERLESTVSIIADF